MRGALKSIGLTDSEIKVYLALLDLGDSTRSGIVNKSGVSGSKVYDLLEKLQEKGLVSICTQDKVKHFKPINPNQILNYLEDKKVEVTKMEEDVRSIIPQLLAQFNSAKGEQEVELLSGLKGLEIIFREQVEMLNKGETCYVIGGTKGIEEEATVAFFQKVHLLREKKGIKTRMLYNFGQKESTKKAFSRKLYPHTETRYITTTSPVAINIYKDRTAILVFGKTITAIHLRSQDIANSFLEYFKLLWKISKP